VLKREKHMPLWQHLEELRWMIFKILGILAVTTIVSFFLIDQVFEILMIPLNQVKDEAGVVLNQAGPFDGIIIKLKSSLLCGIVLGCPFILAFVWSFISPGLKDKEIRVMMWVCFAGTMLFMIGVVLGFMSMSKVLPIMVSFGIKDVKNIWQLRKYFDFLFYWLLGAGLMFELPLLLVLLTRYDIMSVKTLKKGRPFAYIIILIIAAICTPPDPVTQLMMGLPLFLLYELGIFISSFHKPSEAEDDSAKS